MSIPHGGDATPPQLEGRVAASAAELFEDGDAFTREIYDLGESVAHVEAARVARAFVDINRDPADRPPGNPDGVVKTATCWGRPVYREPLDAATVEDLLERYHAPYHAALERAARRPGVRLGLDCHSMAAEPPPVAPDRGGRRPLFCLSDAGGATCDPGPLEALAAALRRAFDCPPGEVAHNQPFQGGYVIRRHGRRPLPWIQVEMSRALYLAPPWYDPERRRVDPARLAELRERFARALETLADALGSDPAGDPARN